MAMLIPAPELRFDFEGAQFDLSPGPSGDRDRKLLGWVLNQFLYGEVTGIQCGHWLYRAPHLNAATFLAKQAGEELAHVRKILRLLTLIGERPADAHRAVKFLSTGMMGGNWGEHVALEMALGEGLVLAVFYALVDTTRDSPEVHKILDSAAAEEERHVEFGERETRAWLEAHPGDRARLLGLALVQTLAMRLIKRFVIGKLQREVAPDHPVLSRFDAFYDHTLLTFELRIQRLGLSEQRLSALSAFQKFGLLLTLPGRILISKLGRRRLLTQTYLQDPVVKGELTRGV